MKYIIITGASSRIGYATALAFAERGKNLIITARRTMNLENLKKEINNRGFDVDVIIETADLSLSQDVFRLYQSIQSYELEGMINCAGFGDSSSVRNQDIHKVDTMIRLNVEAVTLLSTLFVKEYAETKGTQLINVSSAAGYIMIEDFVAYSASKFFISAYTEGLAQELKSKKSKLKVKVLAPAVTKTEFEKKSLDVNEYDYSEKERYHTTEQMAEFMLELYDSDKIVGIVDEESYKFVLRDPIFPFRGF